jgi:hypothetical protein
MSNPDVNDSVDPRRDRDKDAKVICDLAALPIYYERRTGTLPESPRGNAIPKFSGSPVPIRNPFYIGLLWFRMPCLRTPSLLAVRAPSGTLLDALGPTRTGARAGHTLCIV